MKARQSYQAVGTMCSGIHHHHHHQFIVILIIIVVVIIIIIMGTGRQSKKGEWQAVTKE